MADDDLPREEPATDGNGGDNEVRSSHERAVDRAVHAARARAQSEIGSILDAAWRVLARTGWQDLKIGMVLDQAQVSTRNFYRNFSGKSELLIALFEEEVSRFAAQLSQALAEATDPVGRVEVWVAYNLKRAYSPRSQARTRLFAAEGPALAPEFPDDVRRIRRLLLDPLSTAITEGVRTGMFRTDSPDGDAITIWLLTSSLMREPEAGEQATATYASAVAFVLDRSFRLLGAHRPAGSNTRVPAAPAEGATLSASPVAEG